MCKVATIMNLNTTNYKDAMVFIKKLGDKMSYSNRNGIGYAALNSDGLIFGERWLRNFDAFSDFKKIASNTSNPKDYYNWFGRDLPSLENTKAMLLHTRMSTCGGYLENNHPFVDNPNDVNFALIHNGVIHNHNKFKKIYSTCDSETLLWKYIENDVSNDIKNVSKMVSDLDGWYTICVMGKNKYGNYIDYIFDSTVRLSSIVVTELKLLVSSTSLYDLINICRELGYNYVELGQKQPNRIYRTYIGLSKDSVGSTYYAYK